MENRTPPKTAGTMEKPRSPTPEKGGKGGKTSAVSSAESTVSINPSDSISNVGAISNITIGQMMQMIGSARANAGGSTSSLVTTTTPQKNGVSGISTTQPGIIGATRNKPQNPRGLLLVDSGAVDSCFPIGTFDTPVDTSKKREL